MGATSNFAEATDSKWPLGHVPDRPGLGGDADTSLLTGRVLSRTCHIRKVVSARSSPGRYSPVPIGKVIRFTPRRKVAASPQWLADLAEIPDTCQVRRRTREQAQREGAHRLEVPRAVRGHTHSSGRSIREVHSGAVASQGE